MANVGSGAPGKTLIGTGNGASPSYASIGTNSGLTAHGVVVAEGNGAFSATSAGTLNQVLTSNGASSDPTFQAVSASGAITTITGDTGSVTPSSGNVNIQGGAPLSAGTNASVTSGSGATLTVTSINCAKWIVDATANRGTHTTIPAAITAASAGDTVFIRPGTYVGNVALKPGVNLTAFGSDSSLNATGNVVISGTCSLSSAGSVTLSGIELGGANALLAVTGSAASVVNLFNCYLNVSTINGIAFSTANTAAAININCCNGDISTGSVALFQNTSTGTIKFTNTRITNSGGTGVTSTTSAGHLILEYSELDCGITSSSTALLTLDNSIFDTSAVSQSALAHGGSTSSTARKCTFISGTFPGIIISTTLGVFDCIVDSTSGSPISGAGTIVYSSVDFSNTSSTIGTSTKTSRNLSVGSLTLNTALTVGNGGTGQTTLTNHGVLVGAATSAITQLGAGSAGQVLQSGGASADPSYSTATYPSTAGTSGNVLTSDGTNFVSSAPASQFTPNSTVQIFDDFIGQSVTTGVAGYVVGQQVWYNVLGGGGIWNGFPTTDNAHPGIIGNASISVASFNALMLASDIQTHPTIALGGGALTLNWVININTLSDLTNRYVLTLGLGDTINLANQVNGVYLQYSNTINTGQWNIITAAASTRTTTNSSVAVTTGWHNVSMVINAGATSIQYFVDGVSLGTITTNIPTALISPLLNIVNSSGTIAANSLWVDLFYMKQTLTVAR